MSKFKNYLFASLLYSNECADDDTMFISPKFEKWADEFESWMSNTNLIEFPRKYTRNNYETHVVFSDDQENIWFAKNLNVCPWIKNVFHCYTHAYSNGIDEFRYEP